MLAVATYLLLTVPLKNMFDFYPRWIGARAALQGNNPYAEEVTNQIQEGMFGRLLESHEPQQRFYYTPTIVWLLLPFWFIPFPISVSLWSALQFLCLLFTPLVIIATLRWKLEPMLMLVLLLFSVLLFRHPINAYLLGQFIPLVLFCITAAVWGLTTKHEFLAGLSMVMTLIRPEVSILFILVLLIIAWQTKQKKVILVFFGGGILLWILSFLRLGFWELDFLNEVFAYSQVSTVSWPPGAIDNSLVSILLAFAIISWIVWIGREMWFLDHLSRPSWLIALTILASLLLLPQTGGYTLLLVIFPVWILFWATNQHRIYWIPLFLVLLLPWLLLITQTETLWEHLIIPLSLAVIMTFYWRYWKNELSSTPTKKGLLC